MVTGLSFISARLTIYSFLGALAAIYSSWLAKEDKHYLRQGISGYCGAVFGVFWSWYFQISLPALALFLILALFLTPVRHALIRHMLYGRFSFPIMTIPSVLMFYLAIIIIYWLVFSATLIPPHGIYALAEDISPPLFAISSLEGNELYTYIQKNYIHAFVIILIGILIHSRISAVMAVVGVIFGILLCGFVPAYLKTGQEIFLGFNAFPAAVALFGIFFVPGWRMFIFTVAALWVCAFIWIIVGYAFKFINLPFLTIPFNLTIILSLIMARRPLMHRLGVFAVPFHMISSPENIRKLCGEKPRQGGWISRLRQALSNFTNLKKKRAEESMLLDVMVKAKRISIVSGAGTSTESGIPDFSDGSCYWKIYGADEFTFTNYLERAEVRQKYWLMQMDFSALIKRAKPNNIHRAAKFLENIGKLQLILTQNVDGLFQKAGVNPETVIELHGNIEAALCSKCKTPYPINHAENIVRSGNYSVLCPNCSGLIKPSIVLMGEELNGDRFGKAVFGLLSSDLIVIIGTSLRMEPIAYLVDMAVGRGIKAVFINTDPTDRDGLASLVIYRRAGKLLKTIMSRMGSNL